MGTSVDTARTIGQRVIAYITRRSHGATELLVFKHRDYPDAGVQVPAGGVEPGETLEEEIGRDVSEESGITGARILRKLAEETNEAATANDHIFHMEAPAGLPDAWDWLSLDYHSEEHRTAGKRLVFCCYWIGLGQAAQYLAGGQGRWLNLIK